MEYDINIRVSNRHVHLTKEVYDKLFDEEIDIRNNLSQVGEFASNKTLTIKNGDRKIENVRVVGPFRSYDQVEISKRDARLLGVNPPVRKSGDLEDSLEITLETNIASIKVKGLIIAKRHVHMTNKDAEFYGVVDNQMVGLKIGGEKSAILDAEVKISDNGVFEAHIDTDDACATLIEDNDKAKMVV